MKKNLYKVALLSSTLFLVGCGGSNGDGSSTESGNVGASFQSQLDDIQRRLKDVNTQAGQNQAELTMAEKVLAEKKAALDKAQASVTEAGEVEAAQ